MTEPKNVQAVGFTGHRDRITHENLLGWVAKQYPGALWIHGGAPGFDAQVEEYAKARGIRQRIIRPDYRTFPPKVAPLIRNEDIVNACQVLVACWDRRQHGGTYHTVNFARKVGRYVVPVAVVDPAFAARFTSIWGVPE